MVNDPPPEDEYDHEEDVRQIVAQLGVADFVYTVPVVAQGGATREVGDALLFSNGLGAILQMKARQAGSREEDGSAWVARRGGKAYRQGQGTRRMMVRRQAEGSTIVAYPVRAADWEKANRELASLPLTMDVSGWPVVVILDHPSIDGIDPPDPEAFWITTADWLELNRALRSVTALLTYVRRVLDAGIDVAVPLGSEAERFRRIVAADAQYADAGGPMSRPWLTASSLADPAGADLYRELLTRLWPPDASRPHVPISDLRRVLEFLDALPPGMQATVGRWILRKRGELRTGPWASGAVMWSGDRLLVFGCARAGRYNEIERFDADLAAIACVRWHPLRQACRRSPHQPSSPSSSWNVPVGPSGPMLARRATTWALSAAGRPGCDSTPPPSSSVAVIPGSTALNLTSGTAFAYRTVSMETAALLAP